MCKAEVDRCASPPQKALHPLMRANVCKHTSAYTGILTSTYTHTHKCTHTYILTSAYTGILTSTLRSLVRNDLLVPRSRTSTSQQWAFASAGPLLWNCLPVKTRAQILSSSLSSTPRLLKSFLFPGDYCTGGRLALVFTASGAVYKYVNRIE